MDQVFTMRRMARIAFGFLVLILVACGPVPGQPLSDEDHQDVPITEEPGDPGEPPQSPVAGVVALWERKHPVAGPDWTAFSFDVIRTYGSNLLTQAADATKFCPAYHNLSTEQKISFWVYFVSAMTKYESNFDPLNRYRESDKGTDPVTREHVYSEGLLQLSYQDSRNYSFCNEFDWSKDKALSRTDPKKTILDPYKNLQCGIRILNHLAGRKKAVAFGSGHYWAVLKTSYSRNRVKEITALTKQISFCRK